MFTRTLNGLWRAGMAAADTRALWRHMIDEPTVDVAIITNARDEAERSFGAGGGKARDGHSPGPRLYLNGVAGRVRMIDSTAADLMTKSGRRQAQDQFISAVDWARQRGARTVLLGASTKRLFGREGTALREMYPDLLFTIGDNGTAVLLCRDIARAFGRAGLSAGRTRVLVIGPYGILGRTVTEYLTRHGFQTVGFGGNRDGLQTIATEFGIPVTTDLATVGPVDAVIACTHSPDAKLTVQAIDRLRPHTRKLLVIDVAEPANLDRQTWRTVRDRVIRQDAGNGSSRQLRYVLGGLSSSVIHLSRHVAFGCFSEAMTLHHALHHQGMTAIRHRDWFNVCRPNQSLVAKAFRQVSITCPPPHCFGRHLRQFDTGDFALTASLQRSALPHAVAPDDLRLPLADPAVST